MVLRDPVQFLARPHRRGGRRDHRRGRFARREVARAGLQGDHPRRAVALHRPGHRRHRHLGGVPAHPGRGPRAPARTGSGSARSARRPWCRWPTGPTTPRRPWASSPWPWSPRGRCTSGAKAPDLGDRVLRPGHQPGHLDRGLAGHPDHGQGPDRDRVAPGHGGRGVVGVGHPAVQPLRLLAVDHPGGDRVDPRVRGGPQDRGALERGRPDGLGLDRHHALGRRRGRPGLRHRQRHRGQRRRHRGLPGRDRHRRRPSTCCPARPRSRPTTSTTSGPARSGYRAAEPVAA